MPPSVDVCRQLSTQAASAPNLFLPGEHHLHVLQPSFAKRQEDDAVIGGNIHQPVPGEILEHAFTDSVVGGGDAEG